MPHARSTSACTKVGCDETGAGSVAQWKRDAAKQWQSFVLSCLVTFCLLVTCQQ